jgi:hypothetical protein
MSLSMYFHARVVHIRVMRKFMLREHENGHGHGLGYGHGHGIYADMAMTFQDLDVGYQ